MARSRAGVVVALAAALAGSVGVGWWIGGTVARPTPAIVIRAIDGDTVVVRTGSGRTETVRLLGIDTPETHDPRKPVQCFGPEAAAYTKRALTGRRVRLELDVEARDKYGRLLAYVYLDREPYNERLLKLGYARLLVIPPNGSHARTMLHEEIDARAARVGLWGACEGE